MTDSEKELVKRLRKAYAEITFPGGVLVPHEWKDAADAIETLLAWKKQMTELQATWDVQTIGKLLNLPLGSNILPAIQPAIERLIRERDEARAELSAMRAARDEIRGGT